ncbi:hypothetical protein BDA96_04G009500 [Sorghum bicolor]|uniref:Uncharacterized protein n=2 Tax=Sorghum bicolor TaxID=4558 RepID=A0A194YM53_SORBI|nr:hypothetical protein BDA96_04G009500 [Sorghum bicolor]KXG29282.1 hypothetical protein SORBI_3004G008500 [Sorghum bicolor]
MRGWRCRLRRGRHRRSRGRHRRSPGRQRAAAAAPRRRRRSAGCRAGGADGPGRGGGCQGQGVRRPLIDPRVNRHGRGVPTFPYAASQGLRINIRPKTAKFYPFPYVFLIIILTCFIHPSYCDCDRLR